MKKQIFLTSFLLLLSFCLQTILIGTSPKIDCSQIKTQFYVITETVLIQYIALILIEILILKFWIKSDLKKNIRIVLIFTVLFLCVFTYLFYECDIFHCSSDLVKLYIIFILLQLSHFSFALIGFAMANSLIIFNFNPLTFAFLHSSM